MILDADRQDNNPDDLSTLPERPEPDQLLDAYRLCRMKLVRANRSRGALKAHDDRRHLLILELRQQLNELEKSLRDETSARIRIHELNLHISEVVRDLESELNQAAEIVSEPSSGGLTTWVVRFARLLPIVLRLREVKARTARLFGHKTTTISTIDLAELSVAEPSLEVPVETETRLSSESATVAFAPDPPLVLPPERVASLKPQQNSFQDSVSSQQNLAQDLAKYGPLLLRDLDYAYGLLLLHSPGDIVPAGFKVEKSSSWLPDYDLLVPDNPIDPEFSPIEAGIEAITSETILVSRLETWLTRGVLPFSYNPALKLLQLIPLDQIHKASHVLLRQEDAAALQDAGASTLSLDLDENLWCGFALISDEDKQALRGLLCQPSQKREQAPRLSTRGGIRIQDSRAYLAMGLGLPLLVTPPGVVATSVLLLLADGKNLIYEQVSGDADERQVWQPRPSDRQHAQLETGPACFRVEHYDGAELLHKIQLDSLPNWIRFRRAQPLDYREDWGLSLGSITLTQPPTPDYQPSKESLIWAWQRLYQGDYTVNHLFELQMLESLAALFQRRASIPRRDFFQLYAQLRNKPDEWPQFPDAVLRGWCEGGWLEEGLERGSGRWRIQAVDPRLVCLERGGAQLVGLLSARGLRTILAFAYQLGLEVRAVAPSCADMPRGWRFEGDVERLAHACRLHLIDQAEWVPDPTALSWTLKSPGMSDSPPWPSGGRVRETSLAVCGRRGLNYHWMPRQPLPAGWRAPNSLEIQAEITAYGKRRWKSHNPIDDIEFVSCHRNRVVLHALAVHTDGRWPFGFTDRTTGQLDRLYDADAYLPLPLGRYLALTGNKMPGPTRHRPSDHTYRYHMDPRLLSQQFNNRLLPLTNCEE